MKLLFMFEIVSVKIPVGGAYSSRYASQDGSIPWERQWTQFLGGLIFAVVVINCRGAAEVLVVLLGASRCLGENVGFVYRTRLSITTATI